MDMTDDKEYDKKYDVNKIVEEQVTDDIEVFKLEKLSSKQNYENIER